MTLDDHTEQEAPRSPQAGNGFLLAGAIVAPCAVLLVATTPLQQWVHDILLFGPGLTIIIGIVLKVAERVIAAFQRHVKELMRQQAHVEAKVIEENGELTEQNGKLAAQLEANNHLLRQLTAQPTVRLEEVKRELRAIGDKIADRSEGMARDLTVNAISDMEKSSAARHEVLTEEFRQVKLAIAQAYVDSLGDHPAQLRAVPPPRGRWTQDPV